MKKINRKDILWKTTTHSPSASNMIYGTETKQERDKKKKEYIYKNLNE